jgi:drug/metabolite transporter (DMT)-like permease
MSTGVLHLSPPPDAKRATAIGIVCGVAAAACWAASFVAARHGVRIGFSAADLVLYRFLVSGLILLPLMIRAGLPDLGGIGWRRGLVLAVLGGPVQAMASFPGFTLVPLGHGVVIQPACATLGGMLAASLFLGERLSIHRILGALAMVLGLLAFGAEATTFGPHAIGGDLLFVTAGLLWASFGIALKVWRIDGPRAAMAISTIALLIFTPAHGLLAGYDRILALPLSENLLQLVVQGLLGAALPIYLFGRAITLLGAGRTASFTALVPCFALVIGALTIGEFPSVIQLAGLAIVVAGFRFAVKP